MAHPTSPPTWNRDAVLAGVDLVELADELLGPHAGSSRSPTWPCPNPDHPQTGRTPPVSVFVGRDGQQRWHCHGCGNRGTAIDLLVQTGGVGVRQALDQLAARSGLPPQDLTRPGVRPPRPTRPAAPPATAITPRPVPELETYVAQCAEALWRPGGAPIRRWLTDTRGLPAELLRAHRVGADLGPRRQPRPLGVARWRRDDGIVALRQQAVVLPVLVEGQTCYLQLRTLGARSEYVLPDARLYPNPRLGLYHPVQDFDVPWDRSGILIVTEGIFDALAANAGGYRAAAVLSASYADPAAAVALARQSGQLVVAFDPDPAGRAARDRLIHHLNQFGRRPGVLVLPRGDLNEHLARARRHGYDWPAELAGRVSQAVSPGRIGLTPHHGVARAPLGR